MGALKAFVDGLFMKVLISISWEYKKLSKAQFFFSFPIRHPLTFPNKEIDIEKE